MIVRSVLVFPAVCVAGAVRAVRFVRAVGAGPARSAARVVCAVGAACAGPARSAVLPVLAAVVVAALPAGTPAAAGLDPAATLPVDSRVRLGRLENGLAYYVRENHKPENRVELRLAVNAGSVLEEDDQRGLAHFLEHMAFNGTEHFEANELIAFLESIGSRFGADLNAYTSMDETVYMLEIPTDKEGLLEKGVLVLADWARGITLDPQEVEKERGVVLEEWRLGRGAQERLRRVHWPALLEGSRYAERLPIGDPEVIRTAPVERIRDFYDRWYRPDLMAVVAVGAFDADEMETLIREAFSPLAAPETPASRPEADVPPHRETRASAAADQEMPYTQAAIYFKRAGEPDGTVADYRRGLVTALVGSMLNARLGEITEQPDAPFLVAGSGSGSPFRTLDMFQVSALAPEGGAETALAALITEINRVRAHGFGEGEVERAKARLLAGLERAYNERDKTESSALAGEYVRNFLEEEPIPGIEAEYEMSKELLDGITAADVPSAIDRLFPAENRVILVSAPEKEGSPLTPSETLLALHDRATGETPEPYVDDVGSQPLLAQLPPAGTVESRRTDSELGLTVLTLSNGVEVRLKPTDFKNDEVLFAAQAPGGLSLADREALPSAAIAVPLVNEAGLGAFTPADLEKMLSGKIVSVSPSVSLFTHGIDGRTTPRDLETALQILHLAFTAPNPRPEAFEVLMERSRSFIANREARPETRFFDRVRILNHSDHYLFQPPSLERLELADRERAMAFYRNIMSDASDFRFFFVGAFDPETIEPLLARYLGSLPSTPGTPPAYRDPEIRFPPEVTETVVRAGTEPKSQTRITWPALTGLDEFEMFRLRKANDILQIRLRELMREELGSTYSVGVGYSPLLPYPGYGSTSIFYGSAPENADRLKQAVMEAVEALKNDGPTGEEVETIRELEFRALETALERNGYWLGSFTTLDLLGWEPRRILQRRQRIETLTGEGIRETFARYYPRDNYTVVTLLPEAPGEESKEGSR